MTTEDFTRRPRSTVRRLPERAAYDRETIYRILDEGLLCHVGLEVDGRPFVIPMAYARRGDALLLHGSAGSRLLRELGRGRPACITVTLLDGLVLARSAFHHSMNYRSVVIFGTARRITGPEKKRQALDALVEHLVPGRTRDARGASEQEMKITEVVEIPLEEASAKLRVGPPADEPEDMDLPVWAGVLPLGEAAAEPIAAPDLRAGVALPGYVRDYSRPGRE
jgi:nitroimidazol reductase NimA-like FMN-containing flavoprotein (pyridoxamine 5'-phosphate oxidase superfamily)